MNRAHNVIWGSWRARVAEAGVVVAQAGACRTGMNVEREFEAHGAHTQRVEVDRHAGEVSDNFGNT